MASLKVFFTVKQGALRFFCLLVLVLFFYTSLLVEASLAHLLHLVPLVFQGLTEACNVISALIQEGQVGRISDDKKNSDWPEALCTSQQAAT